MDNILGSSPFLRIMVETLIVGVSVAVGFVIKSRGWKNSIVGVSTVGLAVALVALSIVDDLAYWANIGFNSPLTLFIIYNLAIIGFVFSLFGFFEDTHKALPITTLSVSFAIIMLPVLATVLISNIP
ncbi:MAG: hypothetical protein KA140_07055 [Caldisericia bacterium]|nr:hypothetical protein [Caldisericia bacterium]